MIIGGGASGMMAAITVARLGGTVTIIESQKKVGKKILATGNGRCNFTNQVQETSCYHSDNVGFPFDIYQQFPYKETIVFFEELGIYPKSRNGYIYPYSDQAIAILDVLKMELERLGVQIIFEMQCKEIILQQQGFLLTLQKGCSENVIELLADKVIIATGSKASNIAGSDGAGYNLAKSLGHTIVPVLPGLVSLRCAEPFYKRLVGLRMQGNIRLFVKNKEIAQDQGEIQLTNYGISGIPVFQVSRFAAKGLYQNQQVRAEIDFMPDLSEKELERFLLKRCKQQPEKNMRDFLIGLFPNPFIEAVLLLTDSPVNKNAGMMSERMNALAKQIKCLKTTIIDTNTFEQAQVCSGGVDTKEVNSRTLESLLIRDLYFAGEVLDVDGICGGYNLQWAWSSGYVTGREAVNAKNQSIKIAHSS